MTLKLSTGWLILAAVCLVAGFFIFRSCDNEPEQPTIVKQHLDSVLVKRGEIAALLTREAALIAKVAKDSADRRASDIAHKAVIRRLERKLAEVSLKHAQEPELDSIVAATFHVPHSDTLYSLPIEVAREALEIVLEAPIKDSLISEQAKRIEAQRVECDSAVADLGRLFMNAKAETELHKEIAGHLQEAFDESQKDHRKKLRKAKAGGWGKGIIGAIVGFFAGKG